MNMAIEEKKKELVCEVVVVEEVTCPEGVGEKAQELWNTGQLKTVKKLHKEIVALSNLDERQVKHYLETQGLTKEKLDENCKKQAVFNATKQKIKELSATFSTLDKTEAKYFLILCHNLGMSGRDMLKKYGGNNQTFKPHKDFLLDLYEVKNIKAVVIPQEFLDENPCPPNKEQFIKIEAWKEGIEKLENIADSLVSLLEEEYTILPYDLVNRINEVYFKKLNDIQSKTIIKRSK